MMCPVDVGALDPSSALRCEPVAVATCQRWRDKRGQVEVKVASHDRIHAGNVKLLANVYVEDVSYRWAPETL